MVIIYELIKFRRYDKNSAGHVGRRCETQRKSNIEIHGHYQKRYEEEWAEGRQHS